MSAELFVCSDVPVVLWDNFVATYPTGSIALDGFVYGEPRYQKDGPYLNANHHEDVSRMDTLSTAQQILRRIRMGLVKAFTRDGVFGPNVYVNDCDQDVCAAWYLLDNVEQARRVKNPALNRFIEVAGTLDATAGAFPYDKDSKVLQELAWVFEPYDDFKYSGEMARKDNDQYRSIIDEVGVRIGQHLLGEGKTTKPKTDYEVIGGDDTWKMIIATQRDGRLGALQDGVEAYVVVQQTDADTWRYSGGCVSDFIDFDGAHITQQLNQAEGRGIDTPDRWGGAVTTFGSPRISGSKLPPSLVEQIIKDARAGSF